MPTRKRIRSIFDNVSAGDNAPAGVFRRLSAMMLHAPAFLILLSVTGACAEEGTPGWDHYGNDAGGTRYSAAGLITADNVGAVRQQWLYRTGDLAQRAPAVMRRVKFETTPILAGDKLVLC
jgi:quinoprotein glucose dehydrogenase